MEYIQYVHSNECQSAISYIQEESCMWTTPVAGLQGRQLQKDVIRYSEGSGNFLGVQLPYKPAHLQLTTTSSVEKQTINNYKLILFLLRQNYKATA